MTGACIGPCFIFIKSMPRIPTMHLMDFDLNLLKSLDALLETRSVTRAARQLGLSQPATSHALSRLRAALGDPLLVRSSGAFVLTEHAERLKTPVKEALERAAAVLSRPEPVSPAKVVRTFVLNLADYSELTLLPKLTERLAREAPGVSIACRSQITEAHDGLAAGADVWIGVNPGAHSGLMAQKLFADGYQCAVRPGHPLTRKKKVTLADFIGFKHVQIAPGGQPGGPLDEALAARGLSRDVALRMSHFLVAPLLVARTDLVLTAPRRLLDAFMSMVALEAFDPPLHVPGFTLQQAWLAKVHADPTHRWFRGLIKDVLNT